MVEGSRFCVSGETLKVAGKSAGMVSGQVELRRQKIWESSEYLNYLNSWDWTRLLRVGEL